MFVQYVNLTVADSEFVGNIADAFGAAIVQISSGFMDVQNTMFDSNSAGQGGGAIAVATASPTDR